MKDLRWYWHRLRAMSPLEMACHARKKWRQRVDSLRVPSAGGATLRSRTEVPSIPSPASAPQALGAGLAESLQKILKGRWTAFGHLELAVDVPPRWHQDALAGVDLETDQVAFGLNHRALPGGADVKLIWEWSRWHQPLVLAQAAHVLNQPKAAEVCLTLLEDWCRHNAPYRGWNWTSALESGIRLIQFTWIDALIHPRGGDAAARLEKLRKDLLVPHVAYTWRHRSFGSSANNHLLGELTGLLLAVCRWPELAAWCASIEELQALWEREILAQFAPDGGNREQALNYQRFSFEFCWQGMRVLSDAGRDVSPGVRARVADAGRFFREVQVAAEPWDYGDSDSAFVSPFFLGESGACEQWWSWMEGGEAGATLRYWMGHPPAFSPSPGAQARAGWREYPDTGILVRSHGPWFLRWDASPLGYLATAAHGHLDAQHLSLWLDGVAWVVDPGTGAYYGDTRLRAWLASRAAHNGPAPEGRNESPRRLGPFLWESHHARPTVAEVGTSVPSGGGRTAGGKASEGLENAPMEPGVEVRFSIEEQRLVRRVSCGGDASRVLVQDGCFGADGSASAFSVRWQFAPGTRVTPQGPRAFLLERSQRRIRIETSEAWDSATLMESGGTAVSGFDGIVSPAFRATRQAPFLLLRARGGGDRTCVFSTTFIAF